MQLFFLKKIKGININENKSMMRKK